MELHIPKTNTITINKSITNKTIKSLQRFISTLKAEAETRGWTQTKLQTYKRLKNALVHECKNINAQNWENKILSTVEKYNSPTDFWRAIKVLKGNTEHTSPYITHNNDKLYSPEEKEPIFRDIWSNIFRITPEENQQFDQHTEHTVNNFININREHCTPYQYADETRLSNNSYLTSKITIEEVKRIIKNMKNNAPGHSLISKLVLTHLPIEAINTLTAIYNTALSLGCLPILFKQAKIIMIPKQNKQTTDPMNYRPISLLEVPGKILERIINNRLRTHLETDNIYPDTQHGFRRDRGTETALAVTTELIAEALSDKKTMSPRIT